MRDVFSGHVFFFTAFVFHSSNFSFYSKMICFLYHVSCEEFIVVQCDVRMVLGSYVLCVNSGGHAVSRRPASVCKFL